MRQEELNLKSLKGLILKMGKGTSEYDLNVGFLTGTAPDGVRTGTWVARIKRAAEMSGTSKVLGYSMSGLNGGNYTLRFAYLSLGDLSQVLCKSNGRIANA